MTTPDNYDTGDFVARFKQVFDDMERLLNKAPAMIRFHLHIEDHLMDSLIEIAALGGPAGEIAAEALIVTWPCAGWEDNINVMLTDYARAITPEEWAARKAAGDLNWPHKHQGLDGWVSGCDVDHVEYEVRPEERDT